MIPKHILLITLILTLSFGCGKNSLNAKTNEVFPDITPEVVDELDVIKDVSSEDTEVIAVKEDVIPNGDLCESAINKFVLQHDDGNNCVIVPKVLFTFTPQGGRELVEYNFDPTSVIKIYFDSEVVYLSNSGQWRDITKEDVLEMVEISSKSGEAVDFVSLDGPVGLDLVSVDYLNDETVITIKPPYDPANADDPFGTINVKTMEVDYGNYSPDDNYNIIVENFAKKSDVLEIATNQSQIESYLDSVVTYYSGEFGVKFYDPYNSCSIIHRNFSTPAYDSYINTYARSASLGRMININARNIDKTSEPQQYLSKTLNWGKSRS